MIATVLASVLSAQASAAEMAKTETWEWDSKVPICTLKQHGPSEEATVTIERTPGGEETELEITLPAGTRLGKGHFLDASIQTDSGHTFIADISVWTRREDHKPQLYVDSPDPAFIEYLAGANSLEVSHPKMKTVSVPIHVPAKIVATLRECEDTTMREWGIDPLAWRSLQSRPLPAEHVRERFNNLDYPADALAASVEADAVVRLDVAPNGSVTNCRMVDAGVPKAFEVASCKVLKGAKFKPATDAGGKLISAPIVYDVRFRIGR